MANQQQHSVVITGASRGIGRRIALAFNRETDFGLILIARSTDGLEETKELCEAESDSCVHIISCDASDLKSVDEITLPEHFPIPKVLVNNAGYFLLKKLAETSSKEFMQQIQANLFTAVNVTNRFLDDLKSKERSLIVNICSVAATEGRKDSGAYSASKHGLLGYTRSLRRELLDTNVGVTAINLGQTESSSWEGSSIDRDRLIAPDDVANLIVNLTSLSERTVVEEMVVKPQHGRVPPM
ncbi:SDR family NAD(P)-dependent oxidoreductase [Fodinibius halophilus]|uniref:SDR family oxidoreductase n=1 Tax=Fodinibius halophilus TaxID=1736908 RepID=A0A6M1TBX8_9BACT|nr:SDR family oxidoreductase [Fodinibius halophilus]NGP89853.1 SDR family oxidoreductase [Fodinibius halophilus]